MVLQCLFVAIIKCKCHLENLCSNKFNKDNPEQFGKVPGKETTSCQKHKV